MKSSRNMLPLVGKVEVNLKAENCFIVLINRFFIFI